MSSSFVAILPQESSLVISNPLVLDSAGPSFCMKQQLPFFFLPLWATLLSISLLLILQATLAVGTHLLPLPSISSLLQNLFLQPGCLLGSRPVLPTACPTDTPTQLSKQETEELSVTSFLRDPHALPSIFYGKMQNVVMELHAIQKYKTAALGHQEFSFFFKILTDIPDDVIQA